MNLQQLLSWKGSLGRKHFFIWGAILFAVKYNLDRLIAIAFDKYWLIINYFLAVDEISTIEIGSPDFRFYLILLVVSIPFIYFGTLLTVKRLRDAGKPQWMVLFFFVPFINLLFFTILLALRSTSQPQVKTHSWIDSITPQSKFGSVVFATGVSVFIALVLSILFVRQFENYGWGVFVGIPFFLGFGTVLNYGRTNRITKRGSIGLAILSVLFFCLIVFVLAVEGIICISMAFPIMLIIAFVGALLAYGISENPEPRNLKTMIFPLFVIPVLGLSEVYLNPTPEITKVTTEITIDASKQDVWNELVAFSEIEEPTEFIFKTGIAYPIHAEIEGKGVGAVRRCNFTTGSFIEPITVWNEPELLEFSVLDQPPPMIENSPYGDIHVPHLDGYFKSHKGQFRLETLPSGETLLLGTTWYSHNIWPGFYWRLWSDHILHQIHFRVLNHIKSQAEAK